MPGLPFWPPTASGYASQINVLFGALLIVGALTAGLVFFLMLFFANKYRHGSNADRSGTTKKTWRFEVSWTVATLLIFVGLAVWGADIYLHLYNPPANAVCRLLRQTKIDPRQFPARLDVNLARTVDVGGAGIERPRIFAVGG